MAKARTRKPIETYTHQEKQRLNTPPAGAPANASTQQPNATYTYDPHLSPTLQWAGKTEHTSFQVPTCPLHEHERIDPHHIITSIKRKNGAPPPQESMFEEQQNTLPLDKQVQFYQHSTDWANRLIAGDSLLVINSLLKNEAMAGKVQMVYIDPPYGIKYGSNFQPFVNKRDVKDGKDLTQEPEQIKAFRDTWELGIHSYLTYLRDRLLLAKELLSPSGSCFVQISDENVHLVRNLMDEVFGVENFVSMIAFRTKMPLKSNFISKIADYIMWFGKDKTKTKYHQIYEKRGIGTDSPYNWVELPNKQRRKITTEEVRYPTHLPKGAKIFRTRDLISIGPTQYKDSYFFEGEEIKLNPRQTWKTSYQGLDKLKISSRLIKMGNELQHIVYLDDYPVMQMTNIWGDTQGATGKRYVVETSTKVIQRCMLMCTDPGDLVLDPTCGSGSTAVVAEQWGRRWITCDTSRVALTLAKQRLLTASFSWYALANPSKGVDGGFNYKTVPHVTLKSIANNPDIKPGMNQTDIDHAIAKHASQETLYDQPAVDRNLLRVTGPFVYQAVPAPTVMSLEDTDEMVKQEEAKFEAAQQAGPAAVTGQGDALHTQQWVEELRSTGVLGKGGQRLRFSRLHALDTGQWLHAEGEIEEEEEGGAGKLVVVSFGLPYAPLSKEQVSNALDEVEKRRPAPKAVVFCAFIFDPEAARLITETSWAGVALYAAQMNMDLQTSDLKKSTASDQSFWLVGQPDVVVLPAKGKNAKNAKEGEGALFRVEVRGFDYIDLKADKPVSGDSDKIAMWLLDPNYDGRSILPKQIFFPMAGANQGWGKLSKDLRAELDESKMEAFRGLVSLPFKAGEHKRVAVKVIDDRGIESVRVLGLG